MAGATDNAIERLRAWHRGKPLPRYSTKHFHLAKPADALAVAFVRMGGESAPWGVAVGKPGKRLQVFSVPEARNRELVAEMCAAVAPVLLEHFYYPGLGDEVEGLEEEYPVRQLWVPNRTHLDMLHHLSYAYTFARWAPAARLEMLNALGRLSGWLFREAQRPGQMTVLAATDVLRGCYTFPADSIRQAHLGFLMAWLETKGGRDRRLAAAMEAEQHSISTSLDPVLERDKLEPLVDRWREAQRNSAAAEMSRCESAIARLIGDEVKARLGLTMAAMEAVWKDPRPFNRGLEKLLEEGRKEHWYQFLRGEVRRQEEGAPVFTPSPETDRSPAAAAARYLAHAAAQDLHLAALVHDDRELQDEMIAAGEAIRGTILNVKTVLKSKRLERPQWVISTDAGTPLRIREGDDLCVAGCAAREVRVREIKEGARHRTITVEVSKNFSEDRHQKVKAAASDALEDTEVTLLPISREGISRNKSRKIWEIEGPGSWLTHAAPGGTLADLPEEVAEVLAGAGESGEDA